MNNMPTPPTGKLDTDRRLLLQQQLGELFFGDWYLTQAIPKTICRVFFYLLSNTHYSRQMG